MSELNEHGVQVTVVLKLPGAELPDAIRYVTDELQGLLNAHDDAEISHIRGLTYAVRQGSLK